MDHPSRTMIELLVKVVNRRALTIAMAVLTLLLVTIALVYSYNFGINIDPSQLRAPGEVAMGVLALAIAYLSVLWMMSYLRDRLRASHVTELESRSIERRLDEVSNRIREAESREVNTSLQISDEEKARFFSSLQERLEATFRSDLLGDFERKFSDLALERHRHEQLVGTFSDARNRLTREIELLERRGNLNLSVGRVISLIGIIFLCTLVFRAPTANSVGELTNYHIPRIAVVIFIQIFGFFFLRLYRTSLDGIKYFHNELTNLEIKFASVLAALSTANEKTKSSILIALANTERNFILTKGQSTVELERSKIDASNDNVAIMQDILARISTDGARVKKRNPRARTPKD